MEKSDAKKQASEESKRRGDRSLKKINQEAKELANLFPHKKVRILIKDSRKHPDHTYSPLYSGDESHRADMERKQLWSMGFKNEVFKTLEHVVDRLCATINALTKEKIKRITHRDWIELAT